VIHPSVGPVGGVAVRHAIKREEAIMTGTKLTRALGGLFIVAAFVALPTVAAAQTTSLPVEKDILDGCTARLVHITGNETTAISTKVTGSGDLHVDVSDVFKGSGADLLDSTRLYTFSDSEQFSFNTPLPVGTGTLDSSFTQKLFLKGNKSLDNWVIRATIVIKVNGQGQVTKDTILTSAECKG
jgi:hypothetical protein